MNLRYLHFLICLGSIMSRGQDNKFADSLAQVLRADSQHIYRKTLAKPFLRVENRNSFIIRQPVDFYGGLAGVTFSDRHTIAAGFYFLENSKRKEIVSERNPDITQLFIRLSHFSFVYQYVVLNKRYIQIHLPLEVGAGSFYARTSDVNEPGARHHNGFFMPLNGGVQVIGKIWDWLGVSAIGGYRYAKNEEVLLRFNGPYYSYGIWVDARQVLRNYKYRRAKKKHRLLLASQSAR